MSYHRFKKFMLQDGFIILLRMGSQLFRLFNSAWLFPKYLVNSELQGTYQSLFFYITMSATLSQLGLGNAILRYFPQVKPDKKQRASFFGFVFCCAIALYGICVMGCGLFLSCESAFARECALVGNKSIFWYGMLVIVGGTSMVCNMVFCRWFRVLGWPTISSIVRFLIPVFKCAMVWLYGKNYFSFADLLTMSVVAQCSLTVALVLLLMHLDAFAISFAFSQHLKTGVMWAVLKYTLLTLVDIQFLRFIVRNVNKAILKWYLDNAALGIYTSAVALGGVIGLPVLVQQFILMPWIAEAIQKKRWQAIQHGYRRTALLQFISCSILFALLYFYLDYIFSWFGYQDCLVKRKEIFCCIGIARCVSAPFAMSRSIVLMSKHFQWNTVGLLCLLSINLVLGCLWIQTYGLLGIVMGWACGLAVYRLLTAWYVWKKWGLHPFKS